jgi:tyrosyl-tRNA synthetase
MAPSDAGAPNALDVLVERGYVYDLTDEAGLRAALAPERGGLTFYCGFDPTADSLHVGNLLQIMLMAQLQRAGHRPIAIVGGGTGAVGDPSGKQTSRPVLSMAEIDANVAAIRDQLARYLDFGTGGARIINNADWLAPLRLVDFLREIGLRVSVPEMLAAESVKLRLQSGLTFAEFTYRLLQAYDFLHLFQKYGCTLQVGGSDQWGNITAGADLIRRIEGARAFGLVTPLLTTASGGKMGKSESGSVWLDAGKTTPYDFYQYWINTEDADVERFLKLYTFLPMDEIRRLVAREGAQLRSAKEALAFEVTRLCHGEAAAEAARATSRALFSGDGAAEAAPTTEIATAELDGGLTAADLFLRCGLVGSRGEATRLARGGGMYVNGKRVDDPNRRFGAADLVEGGLLLRKGKKQFHRVVAVGGGAPAPKPSPRGRGDAPVPTPTGRDAGPTSPAPPGRCFKTVL